MNTLLNGMIEATNITQTENGALTYKSTLSGVYDMFALGGSFRNRSEEDCLNLFKSAYYEDKELALKCLFYLYDVRGGQGERRFFKIAAKWLATRRDSSFKNLLKMIPEYGRWDMLFEFIDTGFEDAAFKIIWKQLNKDLVSMKVHSNEAVSLCAKWCYSENASSVESKRKAKKFREWTGLTSRNYRKMLSSLRARINVLERLMSENRWDEIQYDKIPSKAGFKYRNAFAKHDMERYQAFLTDKNTTVNAGTLYPYEVVARARNIWRGETTEVEVCNKYWENLADYFHNKPFNGIAVVDTSGSMTFTPVAGSSAYPIDVAIALGLYCADKAEGPFKDYFITFSRNPELVKIKGDTFFDKVESLCDASWGYNTNIEKVFNLLLNTALTTGCLQNEMPKNIIIASDMEFDHACDYSRVLMEQIQKQWERAGYKLPHLIFWNCQARQNNIPMKTQDGITFVSGFSPVLFEQILSGKSSYELMMDKLMSERYAPITISTK